MHEKSAFMMNRDDKPFKRKSCIGCVYHRQIGELGNYGCHYMLDTGEKRECPPEDCTHKIYAAPKRYHDLLKRRAEQYFMECRGRTVHDEDGKPIRSKDGRLILEGTKPPTVSGLAIALGLESRYELFALREDEAVGDVINKALARCEAYLEERLYESANGIKMALQYNFPSWNEEAEKEADARRIVHVKVE